MAGHGTVGNIFTRASDITFPIQAAATLLAHVPVGYV